MRISDWSSDVCSSDLPGALCTGVSGFTFAARWRDDELLPGGLSMKKTGAPRLSDRHLQKTVDRLRKKHRVCGISLAILNDGDVHAVASGWANRSEERRVGQECVSKCRSRWSPYQ